MVVFHSQKHNAQHQKRSFAKISWCKINIQRFKFSVIQVMYIMERFTFGSWFWNQKKRKKWKIWETINWDKVFKNGPSTVFQKCYLIHSWVPCPNCSCVLWQWNNKMNKISIYVGTGNWLDIGIHYPRHNFFKGKFTRMSNWYHYSLLFPGVCFYQIYCDEWLFFY